MHVTISTHTESCKKRFTLYIVMSDVGEDEEKRSMYVVEFEGMP